MHHILKTGNIHAPCAKNMYTVLHHDLNTIVDALAVLNTMHLNKQIMSFQLLFAASKRKVISLFGHNTNSVGPTTIGVTYEGYQYPHFLNWGYRPPTFQDTGEAFAVIRGDLWRSNYTKTVFAGAPQITSDDKELLSCVVFQV